MGKADDKKRKSQKRRTDAVRSAVDQAFTATADRAGVTQKRAQEIADELVSVVGRLREVVDDARPATAVEVEALRGDIAALAARVERLERAGAPAKAAARKPAGTRKPAARKPAATPASKVPAARAAARRTAR